MTIALSFVSPKGGVGKTTLSLNVSLALARLGHRVLLVDVDPQGGIGISLKSTSAVGGLKSYLAKKALSSCVLNTRITGFSILPLCGLKGLERAKINSDLEDGQLLQSLVNSATGFDLVVFDTPSGLAGSTLGALRASDLAIAAMQAEPLSMNTFPQLLETIGELRKEGARVKLSGVVFTMVQPDDSTSCNVVEAFSTKIPRELILKTHIPRDPVFMRASELGVPVRFLQRKVLAISRFFDQLAIEISNSLPVDESAGSDEPISLIV